MLTKLAFKNVGKSLRDYLIYFITLVFGVSIFYMFNSIYAQEKIICITEYKHDAMIALRQLLSYVSVFVAVVLGFLIVYANNFFIKRRKKELGVYLTLGMERGIISLILILETSLMALTALVVGILLGIFGSQFMSVFTAKIFEADLTSFEFIFAPKAALKSILYFGIIFLVVIIFNTFSISKFKLIDLLHGSRKNEDLRINSTKISVVLFIFSIACLIAAYYLILENGMININYYFLASIILGTIGTLLFFLSLSGILTKLIQSNKNIYYKNLNMFTLRQLSSKINTNFVSISVVCITLLLTIGIFSCGYSMQYVLSSDLKDVTPYNMSIYRFASLEESSKNNMFEGLPEDIRNNKGITSWAEVNIYTDEIYLNDFPEVDFGILDDHSNVTLQFIKLSEYNALLKMKGEQNSLLNNDSYQIVCKNAAYKKIASQFIDKNINVTIAGKSLKPFDVRQTNLSNGAEVFAFIVPDEYVENMSKDSTILNINCDSTETELILTEKLSQQASHHYTNNKTESHLFDFFYTKEEIYTNSISAKAIISYLAIYLGIVFMITCAAILAIQQLSESADNKDRYELLGKLGADKKMMNDALFGQIFAYFFLPLVLAVVHSIIGLKAANVVIEHFGQMSTTASIIATSVFVIIVYGTYFTLTYIGSKNIINRG